ncbi:hypothetical protein AMTRI_Chr09g18240 [Amborella trichopoda]
MGSLSFCMCPPSSPHSKPHLTDLSWPPLMQAEQRLLNWTEKILLHAVAGVLSFGFSSNSVAVAVEAAAGLPSHSATAPDCRESEEGGDEEREFPPELVPNRRIGEEAWQIVNDSFFDAHLHSWSTKKWLGSDSQTTLLFLIVALFHKNQGEILSGSIDTRSQAHDIIRRMLASLADPYTRFLTPSEFSKMARYDITGVGMNLRKVPNDDGSAKLKILGIVLGGPAHSAGVRQEVVTIDSQEVQKDCTFDILDQESKKMGRSSRISHTKLELPSNLLKHPMASLPNQTKLDLESNLNFLAGIEVAKRFLNQGETVIYTFGRDPQLQRSITTETAPLISAPVMVATALHDNCRAVLVGEKTFGTGLIQSVFEHDDRSGVVVTIGKYVTPSHMDINGNGIEPDFTRRPVPERMIHCQSAHTQCWSTVTPDYTVKAHLHGAGAHDLLSEST